MRSWLAALALVVAPSVPRIGNTCSLAAPNGGPHQVAADPGDTIAPSPVSAVFVLSAASRTSSCGAGSKCGDTSARINLFVNASDDRTQLFALGIELRVVGGEPPPGLVLPDAAVRPADTGVVTDHPGNIGLDFDDDDEDFSFDLELRAIDGVGNLGPATVITISRG